jgi:hypothetical protein
MNVEAKAIFWKWKHNESRYSITKTEIKVYLFSCHCEKYRDFWLGDVCEEGEIYSGLF